MTAAVNELALCSPQSRKRWPKGGDETRFEVIEQQTGAAGHNKLTEGSDVVSLPSWVPLAPEMKGSTLSWGWPVEI